jgi:hypothetical protein
MNWLLTSNSRSAQPEIDNRPNCGNRELAPMNANEKLARLRVN